MRWSLGMNLATLLLCFVTPVSGNMMERKETAPKAFLSPDNILAGWESTYGAMRSMRVSYVERVVEVTRSGEKSPKDLVDHMNQLTKMHHVERVEDGTLFHIRHSTSEHGFMNLKDLHESSFDGQHKLAYSGLTRFGTIQRGLADDARENMNHLRTYLLSERVKSQGEGEDKAAFAQLLRQAIKAGTVHVEPRMESVAGEMCHVIVADLGGEFKAWVSHAKGMMVMKYQHVIRGQLQIEISVDEVAKSDASRGLWYPQKARRTVHIGDYDIRHELTVRDFEPDIKATKADLSFDFPVGTEVLDKVTGMNFIQGEGEVNPASQQMMAPQPIADDETPEEPPSTTSADSGTKRMTSDGTLPPLPKAEAHAMDTGKVSPPSRRVVWVIPLVLGAGLFVLVRSKARACRGFGRNCEFETPNK